MLELLAFDLRVPLFNSGPFRHPIADVPSVYDLISQILPNAYIIAGLILFFYLIGGGFILIANAGNPEATKNGQKIITNAIIGFIILFCSYWLIQIIEIITAIPILHPTLSL